MRVSSLLILLGFTTLLLSCERPTGTPSNGNGDPQGTEKEAQAAEKETQAGEMKMESRVESAVAVIRPVGESGVTGVIRFTMTDAGALRVHGKVEGLSPGEHGFHVHQYGDLTSTETGQSAGGHFAPRGLPHGAPDDEKRHVGDLGNITANEQGVAMIDKRDDTIRLSGPHSIIGRAIVVHEKADSFAQPSGEAGARAAFGVIGIGSGKPAPKEEQKPEQPEQPGNES